MRKIKYFLLLLIFIVLCTGCSTEKKPMAGYVSEEVILTDVIQKDRKRVV